MKETSKILDIDEERKLVQDRLNELKDAQVSKKKENAAMKELGLERAKLYGWLTTYVFTKAMGEIIIGRSLKINVPIVIARPTLVSSTYKEPLLDRRLQIPGDMVVNALIVAMMTHTKNSTRSLSGDDDDYGEIDNGQYIYHMGGSANREYMNIIKVVKHAYSYFCENPWMDKYGNTVGIVEPVFFPTMASFRQHIHDIYVLPKKERKVSFAKRLVEIYEHYLLFRKIVDDSATEKLRMSMEGSDEADVFDFNPKHIDWKDYFMNIHIPGLIRYVIEGFNSVN
ncbi:alcohol-forming fatty acyl-CoA reductase-like [Papaver somniferum]|uniref:alcohol-forming fatty acyl-CoA reductase-like n=1 Tax=Papaver somniferum TaxID=3469 RepID=UPI000E70265A|nr:alcohol-forming fatty acyl-CoA reductase-like [Papaver somniferum]